MNQCPYCSKKYIRPEKLADHQAKAHLMNHVSPAPPPYTGEEKVEVAPPPYSPEDKPEIEHGKDLGEIEKLKQEIRVLKTVIETLTEKLSR